MDISEERKVKFALFKLNWYAQIGGNEYNFIEFDKVKEKFTYGQG